MLQVAARMASRDENTGRYQRHRPEQTLLYRIVDEYYPAFAALMAERGRELPGYVQREFEEFLKCGRLEHGFLRVRCESCHTEHLVAFSCKRRGFCPSCSARRMAESAALLVDEVLPEQPMRQWVLSFPFQLQTGGQNHQDRHDHTHNFEYTHLKNCDRDHNLLDEHVKHSCPPHPTEDQNHLL